MQPFASSWGCMMSLLSIPSSSQLYVVKFHFFLQSAAPMLAVATSKKSKGHGLLGNLLQPRQTEVLQNWGRSPSKNQRKRERSLEQLPWSSEQVSVQEYLHCHRKLLLQYFTSLRLFEDAWGYTNVCFSCCRDLFQVRSPSLCVGVFS